MGPIVLVRALLVLVGVRLMGRFLGGVAEGMKDTPAEPIPASGRDMVRDRVCNTFLPRERALRALIRGEEAHFCSPACRDRALALQPAQ